MLPRNEIHDAVVEAVDTVRETLVTDENGLRSDETTVLIGDGAALDSMGFVNFVVAVEEGMSRIMGRPFHLADTVTAPDAEMQSVSTVGQFIDFLDRLVNN